MGEAASGVRGSMTSRLGDARWLGPLLVSACMSAVSPDAVEPRRDAEAPEGAAEAATAPGGSEPAPDPAGPLEVELDGAAPRPVAEVLPRVPQRDAAPGHAERAAWSADGETFAHCRPRPELECTECRLLHRDGTTESLETGPGCGDRAVSRTALDARLAALRLAPAPTRWRAGADVVLVIETREHEQTHAGQPRPMLKLGARRRDAGPPVWLLHVDPCQGCGTDQVCAATAHVDALALSPDGERLAVLLHQRSALGDESTRIELLAADRIVAAASFPASRATP